MLQQDECRRLVKCIRLRLKKKDYEAIYTGGECFRFALRLHERYKWKIRGIDISGTSPHVWAIDCNGQAVDIYGVHPECLTKALAEGNDQKPATDADIDIVRTKVETRGYPASFAAKLDKLVGFIFDSHQRFEKAARPCDSEKVDGFVKDIEQSSPAIS